MRPRRAGDLRRSSCIVRSYFSRRLGCFGAFDFRQADLVEADGAIARAPCVSGWVRRGALVVVTRGRV